MTNAIDELRRRAEASRPGYTSDSDRAFAIEKGASPFHYWVKFTGTIDGFDFDPKGKNGTLVVRFRNISGDENPRHFDDRTGDEHRMFFDDPSRTYQREWSEQGLMGESIQAATGDTNAIIDLPVGTTISAELDFVPTGKNEVGKDGKEYPGRKWYYRVTSVRKGGTAAPTAKPDAANVAALAAALVGSSDVLQPRDIIVIMNGLGIRGDAPLQKMVVEGKFVAHAEAEGLLASAEGVFYDPTANSA